MPGADAKLDFTIRGAIDQASSMFQVEGNSKIHLQALNPTFTLAGQRTCILSWPLKSPV